MFTLIKKSICFLAIIALLQPSLVAPVFAQSESKKPEPSANDILSDLIYIRTTNFVSTVVGTAWFLVTLPFTAAGQNVGAAAEKLVVNPGKLTFSQPLGDPDVIAVWPFKYDHPER